MQQWEEPPCVLHANPGPRGATPGSPPTEGDVVHSRHVWYVDDKVAVVGEVVVLIGGRVGHRAQALGDRRGVDAAGTSQCCLPFKDVGAGTRRHNFRHTLGQSMSSVSSTPTTIQLHPHDNTAPPP